MNFDFDPNHWLKPQGDHINKWGVLAIDKMREAMMESILDGQFLATTPPPLEHYHADGLYGRRIFMTANEVIISKVHNYPNITVVLTGHCTVVDAKGNKREVRAPDVFVTPAGTQRVLYVHTDSEWLTVHPTELQEVEDIEKWMATDTMGEYQTKLIGGLL